MGLLVSHSQLLLRSPGDLREPPGSAGARNIDLVFVAVSYVELPTLLPERELADSTAGDIRKAATQSRRHLIVAGAMTVVNNDLGLMQSSLHRGASTGAGGGSD